VADWAFSRAEERAAFERFIDFVMNRLSLHPDLHIYHFAPYEPAALKRLMGRYATREDELDQLLRGKRFVDLFAVVRQGLRASVESYSIKRLEPLYGYEREASLPDANQASSRAGGVITTPRGRTDHWATNRRRPRSSSPPSPRGPLRNPDQRRCPR
jgi:predicted RecB family nuclease